MPQVSRSASEVSTHNGSSGSSSSKQAPLVKRERVEGSIRKLLASFGFIAGDDGIDYFLHWSGMSSASIDFRKLHLQMRVSFTPVLGSDRHGVKSWRAVSVMVLDEDL
jgi:cold shock CspA family protein